MIRVYGTLIELTVLLRIAAERAELVLSDRRNRQVMARAKRPAQHAGNGREVQS